MIFFSWIARLFSNKSLPVPTVLTTIEGVPVYDNHDGSFTYTTNWFRCDTDGAPGNPDRDPDWQPDTAVRTPDGKPIDATRVPYFVINPIVQSLTKGMDKGCKAEVSFDGGKPVDAVGGDIGPKRKIGEGSKELARRLGMIGVNGRRGMSGKAVVWRIWPGQPAVIDGVRYKLS
jgi:hypothetical protein